MAESQRFIISPPARNKDEENEEMKEGVGIILEYGSDNLKQVLDLPAVILNDRAMKSILWMAYGKEFFWTEKVIGRIYDQLGKEKSIPHAGRYILKTAANVRKEFETAKSLSSAAS